MNTSVKTILKAASFYALALVTLGIINIMLGFIVYKIAGFDQKIEATLFTVALMCIVVFVFLLVPSGVTGAIFHKFTNIFPDGESRLTLYMVMALVGFIFCLLTGIVSTGGNINRLLAGQLQLAHVFFLFAFLAAAYALNLFFAALGFSIGLRFSRKALRPQP
jgi:hypothetical protein